MAPDRASVALYTRTGVRLSSSSSFLAPSTDLEKTQRPTNPFPAPNFLQRLSLRGVLYKPSDAAFLIRLVAMAVWVMVRLHMMELPFLIVTRFRRSTMHHPLGWPWWWTITMGLARIVGTQVGSVGQMRFTGLFLEAVLPLQTLLMRNIQVKRNIHVKVQLDVLLRPERATLTELRQALRSKGAGYSDDPMNPSQEYLASMHPPVTGPSARLPNLPEEVGHLDKDGTFTLKGEWIEATAVAEDKHRPRSNTVILYFHGGGHAFLSSASHRDFVCRLAREVGPGTRIFSVDYRMAPEHPFPAAIHDAFAAYLYLTEPGHEAFALDSLGNKTRNQHAPVDPRDLVVGGDSAGGNLAAALMLYLTNYVQPATEPKYVMPHAALLLSPWGDPTSSVPAANSSDWYCYCPGPIGTNPFDKVAFMEFKKMNFAANYLCGEVETAPNPRNALGKERSWEWYHHLAQHPLVAPAHHADVSGFTSTLIHTGTHDRLVDDSRLLAHRLGLANPEALTRIENYQDMVHVHQLVSVLPSAHVAAKNIARFIERSQHLHHGDYAASRPRPDKDMVKDKSADNVEWVTIDLLGKESAGDKGGPMSVLKKIWPLNVDKED